MEKRIGREYVLAMCDGYNAIYKDGKKVAEYEGDVDGIELMAELLDIDFEAREVDFVWLVEVGSFPNKLSSVMWA